MLGSEIIDGTGCLHLRCTVEPKDIPGYEEPLPTLIADYWVGKSDYLIRQMVHISQIQDIDTDEVGYYVVRVSDFNQPFEIEPPPTDDTEPSDLPFPEGTFYTGESGYENHPQLVAPGSTLSLNEGQYYVVYPGSMNSNGDIPDELYARIYAKQADPLNAGSPLRKVRSGTGSAAWPWIDTSEWIEISELTGDGTKNCDSVSKARVE